MRKVTIVLIGIIVVLASGAAYLALVPGAANAFRSTRSVTEASERDATALVFVRNPYKDDYGVSRIPGYVENLSSSDIALIQIEVQLWEKEDRRELVKYEVRDVPAGTRKSFDANAGTIGGSRTAQVEVVSLEVYE